MLGDLDRKISGQPALQPLATLRGSVRAAVPLSEIADRATVPAPATAIPYGLADDPAGQAQPEAALDLAGAERLMVAGGPQSGRTTAARALISSLVARFRPDHAHFYVVEQHPPDSASTPDCRTAAGCSPVPSPTGSGGS
jgi:S-DNA-T family DNA segregation ATPase FtsK/SpoIIIE